MDWRRRVDDLRAVQFLWVTLPVGTVFAALAGGALSAYTSLPWWSVAISGIATLVLVGGVLNWLIGLALKRTRQRPTSAYVALTVVIEAGMNLSQKIWQVTTETPTDDERTTWKVRTSDWTAEAERVLLDVAPTRLSAFRADLLFASVVRVDVPEWIAGDLMDLELQIERLRMIRATP